MKELVASGVPPADGDKKMNKVVKVIMLTLIGAGCFTGGIYYATLEFEKQVNVWDSNYQIITDKVYAFEKVSNPKTVRKHINDLNKILDDIDFLHTLIENGQLADESLVVYASMVEDVDDRLIMLRAEMYEELESLKLSITVKTDDKVYGVKEEVATDRKVVLSKLNDINIRLDALEEMVSELSTDVDIVKNSKYGKKIWK